MSRRDTRLLREIPGDVGFGRSPLVEHPQRVREIADDVELDAVVLVDLGREEVDVDDALVVLGVPQPRVVLDHVVAERDDEVGRVECAGHDVLGLQADGEQTVVVVHVDRTLGHHRVRDADAGAFAEQPQLLAGAGTDGAVAGQHDGPLRRLDQLPCGVDALVVGDGATGAMGLDGLEV